MTRMRRSFVVAWLAASAVRIGHAQQSAMSQTGGRPAVAADSVPRTAAEAEAQGRRWMPAPLGNALPLQGVAYQLGGAEQRCVDVGHPGRSDSDPVRSAGFVVLGFTMYSGLWHDGYGKLAWLPINGSTASPSHMVLMASRLDSAAVQQVYDVELNHGQYYMYPADIRLPSTGRWMLIGHAGQSWGCYLFDLN